MAITLELRRWPAGELRRQNLDALSADLDEIANAYFRADVRFAAANQEIFASQGLFLEVPAIGVALGLYYAFRATETSEYGEPGYGDFDPDEFGYDSIQFRLLDASLHILSRLTNASVTVPRDELARQIERFTQDVRDYILEELPELSQHAEIGAWLRGEVADPYDDALHPG